MKNYTYRCQQNLIKTNPETKAILTYLASESNSLYNCCLYYGRQLLFTKNKIVSGYDMDKWMKQNIHFKAGFASSMQQTCHNAGEAFKSYKKLREKFKKGGLDHKPKPPKYRKSGGLFSFTYLQRWLKLENNQIRFPLGKQVFCWFGLKEFYLPFPSNLDWNSIVEVRILPKNNHFFAEFISKEKLVKSNVNGTKALGVDHGINNWLTCVSNIGTSFIIRGGRIKSSNQWYNKQVAKLKSNKPQGFWSKTLVNITEKRNRIMRDAVNKAARLVINHCVKNKIGFVVFGWNSGQKSESNLGKRNNQNFVQIPTGKLKDRLKNLCESYGIEFVETEESYTSKASFLDQDSLPRYGEKPDQWKSSGRRIKRGLFRTKSKNLINADCNGAANILKKVEIKLKLDLSGISRGVLSAPISYSL